MGFTAEMPMSVGIRLGSAALQALADDHGVDLLHVKGAALDPSLLQTRTVVDPDTSAPVTVAAPRPSVDVDVLVRPSQVPRLLSVMRTHNWQMAYRFEDGSPFEHASTWLREGLASADVHRSFPGIGADSQTAFERLWRDRHEVLIAGYPCAVPSVTAQRLLLILHAVRGGDLDGGDIRQAWTLASSAERDLVDELASHLKAELALAAGTGRLEQHRGERGYALWRALSTGTRSRPTLWWARVRAQPTPSAAARVAVRLIAPKPGRLRRDLGREPTVREITTAWRQQLVLTLREMGALLRRPLRSR